MLRKFFRAGKRKGQNMLKETEPIFNASRTTRKKGNCLNSEPPSLDQLVGLIIRDCGNAAKVLEMYYWSQQSSFLEAARALSGLDLRTRSILQSFLTMGNPSMISAAVGEFGDVHLQSGDVRNAMHKLRMGEPAG
jgi:hypothetical protein